MPHAITITLWTMAGSNMLSIVAPDGSTIADLGGDERAASIWVEALQAAGCRVHYVDERCHDGETLAQRDARIGGAL